MLQLDQGAQSHIQNFQAEILEGLKKYNAKHGSLPQSFSDEKLRKFYAQIKVKNESEQFQVGEKTAEFLLFLFKLRGMQGEAIDLCHNFDALVKNQESGRSSAIKNFYLSDSLLNLELKANKNYYKVLQEAVYPDDSASESLDHLTQMTKAYFKDGNAEHALRFFEKGIQQRREQKAKNDERLIDLFDSTFGLNEEGVKPRISFEQFQSRYLQTMLVKEKLHKEAAAVKLLDGILHRCDQEEIDSVFVLQVLLREEREILKQVANFNDTDYSVLYDLYSKCKDEKDVNQLVLHFSDDAGLDPKTGELVMKSDSDTLKVMSQLATVFSRKQVIEKQINDVNKRDLKKLVHTVGEDQVTILGQVTSFDQALDFLGMTREEFEQAGEFSKTNKQLISYIRSQVKPEEFGVQETLAKRAVAKFREQVSKVIEARKKSSQFKEIMANEGAIALDQKYMAENDLNDSPTLFIDEDLYRTSSDDEMDAEMDDTSAGESADSDQAAHREEFKRILREDPAKFSDEELYQEIEAKKEAALVQEDAMFEALNSRSASNLEKALSQFNKIQNAKVPSWFSSAKRSDLLKTESSEEPSFVSIDSILNKDLDAEIKNEKLQLEELIKEQTKAPKEHTVLADPKDINMAIDRFDFLLNDPDSPILSNFMFGLDYTDERDMPSLAQLYAREGVHVDRKLANINLKLAKQSSKMATLMENLTKIDSAIGNVTHQVYEINNSVKEELSEAAEISESQVEERDRRVANAIDQKVKDLYHEFLRLTGAQGQNLDIEANSDEYDGALFAQMLTREQKLDLMEQAVALETGKAHQTQIFSKFYAQDLIAFGIQHKIAESVRLGERMLSELDETIPQELASAVKRFKLANNEQYAQAMKTTGPISIPRVEKSQAGDYTRDSVVNLDDPYWQDYLEKNRRYQDWHKLPSALAFDHKPDEILSSVIDSKRREHIMNVFNKML